MNKDLQLKMYCLVPYNISDKQKGIQFTHAAINYEKNSRKNEEVRSLYLDWSENWQTCIMLDGGTTNTKIVDGEYFGSLNRYSKQLQDNGIFVSEFYEPDLGDQLTGVCFIADERCFPKKYPDFGDWLINNFSDYLNINSNNKLDAKQIGEVIKNSENDYDQKIYNKWVNLIGGKKNVFLKEFIGNLKLA